MADDIKLRLAEWEEIARRLEGDAPSWLDACRELSSLSLEFLSDLAEAPACFAGAGWSPGRGGRPEAYGAEEGLGVSGAMRELWERMVPSGINTASGRYFGFIPGGGVYAAAFGDYLAALSNRYAGLYWASPAAAEIENELVAWLAELFGFGATSWGTLTSCGTIANLIGVLAARDSRPREAWESSTIYLSEHAHNSLGRAIKVAGLNPHCLRLVEVDSAFRIDPQALQAAIDEDLARGLHPWMILAAVGTTSTGSIDPLPELIRIKKKHRLWLHLDAAYGGFFILTRYGRERFGALLHEADTLVVDPHKGLFMPYGLGAVLAKDGEGLRRTFAAEADYLADLQDGEQKSPADYSVELTRHFRGARLALTLKAFGLGPFRAALEEKLLLAHYVCSQLAGMPEIELACAPELSVVAFRVRGDDALSQRLQASILDEKRVFFSSTRLAGKYYLRFAILCFRSHRRDVEEGLAQIRKHLASAR